MDTSRLRLANGQVDLERTLEPPKTKKHPTQIGTSANTSSTTRVEFSEPDQIESDYQRRKLQAEYDELTQMIIDWNPVIDILGPFKALYALVRRHELVQSDEYQKYFSKRPALNF